LFFYLIIPSYYNAVKNIIGLAYILNKKKKKKKTTKLNL